ncbi:hypothetical protein [Methylorubrum extorquens]|uniref:Uncharacterized protein n=1 Tax=Methylorubrum extorquens (strain CM4 / NCIMB 13688) TaxID=440085 RepID=B7L3R7_METC4|nr:hypothetical protein [Methylorubrum extorquens]ACK86475.1 hypothetical protein Mchl_5764 [Methylorubrum extorquens CM4]
MSLADLRRRLERHETARHIGGPTNIVANYPVEDAEGRDAIHNWRQWVQDGRASVKGDVLYLMQPPLTVEEWTAAHVAEH